MGQRKQTAAGKRRQVQRNRNKYRKESAELKAKAEAGELDTSPDALSQMSNSVAKRATTNASRLTATLAKKRFVEQVYENTDRLFGAQLTLALGSVKLFKVREYKNGKRETEAVSDTMEIIRYLNNPSHYEEVDGAKEFYLMTEKDPENKAIDSLLNRAMGAPKQELQLTDESGIFVKDRIRIEVVPSIDLGIQEGELVESEPTVPEVIEAEVAPDAQALEESNTLSRKVTLETQPNEQAVKAEVLQPPRSVHSDGIKITRL